MNHCSQCGQINSENSNFCRFCGGKIFTPPVQQQQFPPQQFQQQPLQPPSFEQNPPRPYVWKTDEFQVSENKKRINPPVNQVQPNGNPYITNQSARPQPLVYQQPQYMAGNYRCPRCASPNFPVYTRKISNAGWIVFAVLLVTFFPLFWIGFLIREDVKICPVCKLKTP